MSPRETTTEPEQRACFDARRDSADHRFYLLAHAEVVPLSSPNLKRRDEAKTMFAKFEEMRSEEKRQSEDQLRDVVRRLADVRFLA